MEKEYLTEGQKEEFPNCEQILKEPDPIDTIWSSEQSLFTPTFKTNGWLDMYWS